MATARIVKALAVVAAAQTVDAHTWVETIRRISSTGSFVGDAGYAMGHIAHEDPGFADAAVQIKMLDGDLKANAPICGNFAGDGYTNPKYPPLKASPGEFLSMQYLENGHVSKPELTVRGFRGGNVMIYGTSEHTATTGINDVMYVWNEQGTGGNQKGKLLASHFFDDLQCYENPDGEPINTQRRVKFGGAQNLPCQATLQLPADLDTSGSYTLYWVWDWPQKPNTEGAVNEVYTSCATVNLQAPTDQGSSAKGIKYQQNKNIALVAIQSQLSNSIEVLARGTGTASPPAPTDVPAATSAAPGVSSSAAAGDSSSSKSRHGGGNGGPKTVTVTADAQTVTRWQTVTIGNGAGGNGAPVSPTSGAGSNGQVTVTSVQPFLKVRETGQARRMR